MINSVLDLATRALSDVPPFVDDENRVGESVVDIDVPYYSGFYGQWGWTGYSDEYCRTADLAWIGTHRHNPYTRNEPYVFTYIYKHDLDLPAGCSSLTLPDDENIVVFAVTLEE